MQFQSNWQRETLELVVAFLCDIDWSPWITEEKTKAILLRFSWIEVRWKSFLPYERTSENINLSSIVNHRWKCWRNASLRIGDCSEYSSKKKEINRVSRTGEYIADPEGRHTHQKCRPQEMANALATHVWRQWCCHSCTPNQRHRSEKSPSHSKASRELWRKFFPLHS